VDKKYPEVPEEKLRGVVRTNFDSPNPSAAQVARKDRSLGTVKTMGLPFAAHLPVVEDETQISPRASDEVAARCLATALCAVKGESNDQELIDQLVDEYSAKPFFSPAEQRFLADPNPSRRDLANFAWRYECVHVFLWALEYLERLNPPNKIADVVDEIGIIRDKGPAHFIKDARIRHLGEILDQADLYYRLHWAAIELRLKGERDAGIDEEIIMERHRALNWLIRYMNQSWDEVTTDT
jgi:hypothetical protein